MNHLIEPRYSVSLQDYESVAHLSSAVRELRQEAETLLPEIGKRQVLMVNSTSRGGGVAELLPPLLSLVRELGVNANWMVMETEEPEFFRLTKRVHNLVHGEGDPIIKAEERALYRNVSRAAAAVIGKHLAPGDILVIHDPQPMGIGAILREELDIAAIWRCHIGLDKQTPETEAAWTFLGEWAAPYDRAVFTAPEYIPGCFAARATVIHPAIDPLSYKNRFLPVHKLVGILVDGSLVKPFGPVLMPPFPEPARRLQQDGSWARATAPDDLGLLFRPIVMQVSRWDRLKGFLPLMEGFVRLKRSLDGGRDLPDLYRRSLQLVRLVMAGPDPASIEDDPEGKEVLEEIRQAYLALEPKLQEAIAIISLPMSSEKHNALLVNAIQRCSDIVAQNSIREGFGLTATEAMWKRAALMGSRAAGLRQQIRPGIDGCLVADPQDPEEIARTLGDMLRDQRKREALGRSAEQRVHHDFLVFTHVRRWLDLIAETVRTRWP